MVAENGKIYVTLTSGNVARLDANTLAFEKMDCCRSKIRKALSKKMENCIW